MYQIKHLVGLMMTDKNRLNHDLEFWQIKLKKYKEKFKDSQDFDDLCTIIEIYKRIEYIEEELQDGS